MAIRFRPFGFDGSVVEVLVGVGILRSFLWTDEPFAGWFKALMAVPGVLILSAGIIGLAVALRRALVARRDRDRASNPPQQV